MRPQFLSVPERWIDQKTAVTRLPDFPTEQLPKPPSSTFLYILRHLWTSVWIPHYVHPWPWSPLNRISAVESVGLEASSCDSVCTCKLLKTQRLAYVPYGSQNKNSLLRLRFSALWRRILFWAHIQFSEQYAASVFGVEMWKFRNICMVIYSHVL
jgi:hypothetical protein